ncbi:MAG: single-stranded DNA-binding protein [Actinomycetota bacterium]|nr:single-stranded DNA-binding protein [Actinomycetota bacterium]
MSKEVKAAGTDVSGTNKVSLSGRVNSAPTVRELPSGDSLVTFRLVVPRAKTTARAAGRTSKQVSDWLDCAVWSGRARRKALSWRVGDQVEVTGALRRRFFRSASGGAAATRVEVEVLSGRVLRRAGPNDRQESGRAQAQ